MVSNELKTQLTTSIVNAVNPTKIILFGSHAYGTADEESDLDIVVVEENFTSHLEEIRKIRKSLADIPLSKDIIVCDEEYLSVHSTADWINTALYDACKKGIVLYEKG